MPAVVATSDHATIWRTPVAVSRTAASATAPPQRQPERATVERLVTEHLPLVGHVLRDIASRVPGHVSRDDLASAGMMALVVSAKNFDESRGVPFTVLGMRLGIPGAVSTDQYASAIDQAWEQVHGTR